MPVLMLKDGRWIVYFYGWVKGMKKKMREYFGRGPDAEIRARARDEAIKRDRLQATVYGGLTFKDLANAYTAAK